MIFSKKFGFIFIKIPKTGSTSVEASLIPMLGPEDIFTPEARDLDVFNTRLLWKKSVFGLSRSFLRHSYKNGLLETLRVILGDAIRGKGPINSGTNFWRYYHHMTYSKFIKEIGKNSVKNFKVVCISRHPYTRLLSLYRYKKRKKAFKESLSFDEWYLDYGYKTKTMYHFIEGIDYPSEIRILRYEFLDRDFKEFCQEFQIPPNSALQGLTKNLYNSFGPASSMKLVKNQIAPNILEKIYDDFRIDFDYFGYSKLESLDVS